jgi:hypothetical protein
MQQRLAKEDVVCMSVSVDLTFSENAKEDTDKALKFLRKQKATFANYLLDEAAGKIWPEYWDFGGPPAVFVLDRGGKKAATFTQPYTYENVEKLVRKLLAVSK